MDKWENEVRDLEARFLLELSKASKDGSNKRKKGTKKPWWEDNTHLDRAESHIKRGKEGTGIDPDSGAHHFAHAGWRLLAEAAKRSGNIPPSPIRYDGERL